MNLNDRIKAYLDAVPGCVAGEGGDTQLFKVACSLYNGFALTEAETVAWLVIYNRKCEPMWCATRLQYKAEQAAQASHDRPRGHLLGGEHAVMPSELPRPQWQPIAPLKVKIPRTDALDNSNPSHVIPPILPSSGRKEEEFASFSCTSNKHLVHPCVFQNEVKANDLMADDIPKSKSASVANIQLDELERQGMPASDRDFARIALDVFQAKPKPKMPPRFDQENAEKRKKKGIKNCSFSPNTVAVYPWAMWERMEATNDPQWSEE